MDVLSFSSDDFDSNVIRSECLVVEFSASIEDFANRASRVTGASEVEWGHVDLRTEASLAATFGVETDVALLIFRQRVVLYLEGGRHDPARMSELIARIAALDMTAIKAEIAAQKDAEVALRVRRVCPTARRGPIGE